MFESHPPHQIPLQDGRLFHQEKCQKIDHEKVCMVEPLSCGGFSQNIARLYVLPAILNYEFSVGPVSANSMTISAVVSGFPTVPAVLVSPQVAGSRARPFSRSNSGDRNYLHHMSGYWMF